ncbi:MAG: lysozyme inhibitor LprI family protein [Mailhella sp.]|nr:lysozyme inhibitor LprI family protein [Mailhella sp.]
MRNSITAVILAAACLIPAVSRADSDESYTAEYRVCMDRCDGSTFGILDCINKELEVQDRLLNKYYKAAMGALSEKGREKLREAQRSWIKMRDADSAAIYDRNEGGSIAHIISGGHILSLTAERAQFLKQLTEE